MSRLALSTLVWAGLVLQTGLLTAQSPTSPPLYGRPPQFAPPENRQFAPPENRQFAPPETAMARPYPQVPGFQGPRFDDRSLPNPVDQIRVAQRGPAIGSGAIQPASAQNSSIPLTPPEQVIDQGKPWYSINYWWNPEQWTNSFELGLNGTKGNSRAFSMRTGVDLTRKSDASQQTLDIDYARSQANSVETQHNALMSFDQEWFFKGSPWSAFSKTGLEYDEFRAFDLRLVLNAGVGYTFFKTDRTKLAGRFGSGVSREFGGPDTRWVPEAVFGLNYSTQLTKRQKFNFKSDYYPEWGEFTDYRLQTDANWELLIDGEANLSLKLGIIDRYDSTPQNRKANDLDYTAVILWKR